MPQGNMGTNCLAYIYKYERGPSYVAIIGDKILWWQRFMKAGN